MQITVKFEFARRKPWKNPWNVSLTEYRLKCVLNGTLHVILTIFFAGLISLIFDIFIRLS